MPPENDRDPATEFAMRAARPVTTYRLVVIEGPDLKKSLTIEPLSPRVLVGTSSACQLVLRDRHVSRRHVALDPGPEALRITDLGSTNGTRVNDVAVRDALLAGGEVVRIGSTALHVETSAATSPTHLTSAIGFGRLLGASVAMRRLHPLFGRLASSDAPVVIEGETGTGKELLAEVLHEEGPRRAGSFVVFDCAAIASGQVEALLFGEENGAKRGLFEQADGGTLFLDEVAELDANVQSKILRAIERGEIMRAGGTKWTKVGARVIAATRRNLDREVQAGRFREDLFFRLAVGRVELPPLRERAGDVELLATFFWNRLAVGDRSLPREVFKSWDDYAWPGNVRELMNMVVRRASLDDADQAGDALDDLRRTMPPAGEVVERILSLDLPLTQAREKIVEDFERRYVERVLAKHDGNVSRAAAASGLARRYFQILRARTSPKK